MNITRVSQEQKVVREGIGTLDGISNPYPQPGKIATLYDGDNVIICRAQLDRAFPGDLQTYAPGMRLDMPFCHALRIETDGQGVDVLWIAPPGEEQ